MENIVSNAAETIASTTEGAATVASTTAAASPGVIKAAARVIADNKNVIGIAVAATIVTYGTIRYGVPAAVKAGRWIGKKFAKPMAKGQEGAEDATFRETPAPEATAKEEATAAETK